MPNTNVSLRASCIYLQSRTTKKTIVLLNSSGPMSRLKVRSNSLLKV